jgi:acyl carrier protein
MQEMDVYAVLREVISEIFMRDDIVIGPELKAADVPGWDSFKQIEIVIALEERFNFKFSTKELDNLANVGDLVRVVKSKAPR